MNLLDLYQKAKMFCDDNGFGPEADWARRVSFAEMDEVKFFSEYVWTVLNSGFRYEVASKYFKIFIESGKTPETLDVNLLMNHKGKRKAIREAQLHHRQWWKRLNGVSESKRLAVLDSLPYIGAIT